MSALDKQGNKAQFKARLIELSKRQRETRISVALEAACEHIDAEILVYENYIAGILSSLLAHDKTRDPDTIRLGCELYQQLKQIEARLMEAKKYVAFLRGVADDLLPLWSTNRL